MWCHKHNSTRALITPSELALSGTSVKTLCNDGGALCERACSPCTWSGYNHVTLWLISSADHLALALLAQSKIWGARWEQVSGLRKEEFILVKQWGAEHLSGLLFSLFLTCLSAQTKFWHSGTCTKIFFLHFFFATLEWNPDPVLSKVKNSFPYLCLHAVFAIKLLARFRQLEPPSNYGQSSGKSFRFMVNSVGFHQLKACGVPPHRTRGKRRIWCLSTVSSEPHSRNGDPGAQRNGVHRTHRKRNPPIPGTRGSIHEHRE